eukprot:scaffold8077_cov98-Skeletonema_dohrnii-CCMP3373.AAC.1
MMICTNDLKSAAVDMMLCCASCGISEGDDIKLKTCTACKSARYCSVKCQKEHRPKHKRACKKRAAELHDEMLFKQPESAHYGDDVLEDKGKDLKQPSQESDASTLPEGKQPTLAPEDLATTMESSPAAPSPASGVTQNDIDLQLKQAQFGGKILELKHCLKKFKKELETVENNLSALHTLINEKIPTYFNLVGGSNNINNMKAELKAELKELLGRDLELDTKNECRLAHMDLQQKHTEFIFKRGDLKDNLEELENELKTVENNLSISSSSSS